MGHQSSDSDDNQVDGDDVVQQPWDDEDQNPGDKCDKWLNDDHIH